MRAFDEHEPASPSTKRDRSNQLALVDIHDEQPCRLRRKQKADLFHAGTHVQGVSVFETPSEPLRNALVGILTSREDAFTRVSAVEALMSLTDDGIRVHMERIAASDTTTGYASPGQPRPFPVKAAAQKWLTRHKP